MDILELIEPKRINDVVGNKLQIKSLKEILNNDKHDKKIILIKGPNGCGKTTIVKLLIKELNYEYYDVPLLNKEILVQIKNFIEHRTIDSFFQKKKKLIFIDNIELSNTILDDINSFAIKYNIFILVLCKNNEDKKILELKNKVEIIKINYPTVKDAFAYLSMKLSNIDPDINDDKLLLSVKKYNGNIRDIILNLYLTDNEYQMFHAFKDLNQFEMVKKLIYKRHSIDEIINLKDDITTVSFLLYENIPDELYTNFEVKKTELMDIYAKLNTLFTTALIFEENMYKTVDWSLFELVCILRIYGCNVLVNSLSIKNKNKDLPYRFSQIISKLSHKNIMKKKIKNITAQNYQFNIIETTLISDYISRNETKLDKKIYNLDECNFINTYQKYF